MNLRTTGRHLPYDATEFGLYVHIPFCAHLCPYCDFAVHISTKEKEFEMYTQALLTELEFLEKQKIQTIFFGGGTPSLLPKSYLDQLLNKIHSLFSVARGAEVTLEINPETVTAQNAKAWKELGFNRASVGIQSMQNEELKRLGRKHSAEAAKESVQILKQQFDNVSVDLIFGQENQTVSKWEETLKEVIRLDVDHISAYNLTIEENTRFHTEFKNQTLKLPSEQTQIDLFTFTRSFLSSHGYAPYEISNFSKPGKESKHNQNYWLGKPYLGVGVGAHSFQPYKRSWNLRPIKPYIEALLSEKLPPRGEEELSKLTHLGERLMTGLRMTEGIHPEKLEEELGTKIPRDIQERIQNHVDLNHIQRGKDRIQLTEKGILISDSVFLDLQPS